MSNIIWRGQPDPDGPMHGYPGWKFWAFVVAFLFLVWLAVKMFYRP